MDTAASRRPATAPAGSRDGGFGVYVHWPFCETKCPYCDFNSHVRGRGVDQARYAAALAREIATTAERIDDRNAQTVFFGGGTPSLMEPRVVGAILDAIHRTWPTTNDMEVTLEANPTSVEAARFADFRVAGVNRVSMGIQALNDADLHALGRLHTAAEGLAAFDIARRTFDRVSFDLMCGRQNQSLAEWEAELTRALALDLDHLSLYQLTVEPGTAFGDRYDAGKLPGLPSDDLSADLYALTQEMCADAGLRRYEVSNHARDGAESRHNLIYWRYGDYVGLGPGAHGRLTLDGMRVSTEQARMPKAWLDGTARDFRAGHQTNPHPDFQRQPRNSSGNGAFGHYAGIVASRLGADGKPVYASGGYRVLSTAHAAAAAEGQRRSEAVAEVEEQARTAVAAG